MNKSAVVRHALHKCKFGVLGQLVQSTIFDRNDQILMEERAIDLVQQHLVVIRNIYNADHAADVIECMTVLEKFLIHVPYNDNHDKIVQFLCTYCESIPEVGHFLEHILSAFMGENFFYIVNSRSDIAQVLQMYVYQKRGEAVGDNPLLQNALDFRMKILQEIVNGKITDVTKWVRILDLEGEVPAILNGWANNGNVVAYDVYFDYFLSSMDGDITIEKKLDEKYRSLVRESRGASGGVFLERKNNT